MLAGLFYRSCERQVENQELEVRRQGDLPNAMNASVDTMVLQ